MLYYPYDRELELEEYCRVQLLLFVPWHDEFALMGDFETHTARFLSMENAIKKLKAEFHQIEDQELKELVEECQFEVSDLVPVLDEEERAAEIVNDLQNTDVQENVPLDISKELGEDYF